MRQTDFFAHLFSDGFIEIRAFNKSKSTNVAQQFTQPGEILKRTDFIESHRDRDVYFGVAARRSIGDGSSKNLLSSRVMFADLDFKTFKNGMVAEAAIKQYPIQPSIIVHSGGGFHCYWLLKEPVDLTTPEAVSLFRSRLRRLAHEIRGDIAAAEPARVLRVPGTVNFKPEYEVPEVKVILPRGDASPAIVDLEQFPPEASYDPARKRVELVSVERPINEAKLARARAYLGAIEPPQLGDGSDHATYRICCKLMGQFGDDMGLTNEETLLVLRDWQPDFTDDWFLEKIANAEKYIRNEDRQPGFAGEVEESSRTGIIDQNDQNVPEQEDDDDNFDFISLEDLFNEPVEELPWLVDKILPSGGDSMLVAKPKVGKSTLARRLALSVATGQPFLGRPTVQGRVLYLALEEKKSEVIRHFRQMGGTGKEPIEIRFSPMPNKDGIKRIKKYIGKVKPVLVIADPLFRFLRSKDANDYAGMSNDLEPIHNMARETGTHIMTVHHESKALTNDIENSPLGSQALFGAVDTLLRMKKTQENVRTIQTIQRYEENLPETTLEFQDGSLSIGVDKETADYQAVEREILAFLRREREAGGQTEKQIHEVVKGRKATAMLALRKLVEQGYVMKKGKGQRKDPFLYSV